MLTTDSRRIINHKQDEYKDHKNKKYRKTLNIKDKKN